MTHLLGFRSTDKRFFAGLGKCPNWSPSSAYLGFRSTDRNFFARLGWAGLGFRALAVCFACGAWDTCTARSMKSQKGASSFFFLFRGLQKAIRCAGGWCFGMSSLDFRPARMRLDGSVWIGDNGGQADIIDNHVLFWWQKRSRLAKHLSIENFFHLL